MTAAVIGGCGPEKTLKRTSEPGGAPLPGGTMVVAASSDLGGVNELISGTSSFTQSVLQLMFLQLFQEQPDFDRHPPTFAPELARTWDWSEDGKVLTLQLRTDAVWSHGEPVTAADVEWSWLAQTHPDVAWGLVDSKENIALIEAIDDYTVRVTYHHQNVTQLSDLNEGLILPRSVWSRLPFSEWRENADWFLDNLVSNGAFLLQTWDRQQQVVLRRNDLYIVPDRPYLDAVVFRIVPQKVNQVGHLLSGDAQFVDHIPAADASRVSDTPGLQVLSFWARQYNFICWNTTRPLLHDVAIRQALTQAIDRQALVDALWFGHARVASSPIISSVWAHNPQLEPWPYDPATASDLLLQQGWRDTDGDGILDRNGEPFHFELMTNTSSAVRVDAAVMIQEQLRRVGIRTEIRRLEFNTLIERSQAQEFDAMLSGWTIDTSLDLDYAFHSDSIDGGYNFGGFSDPRVDRLLEEIRHQTDATQKLEILVEVQELLHQLQPYTLLWEPQRLTGTSTLLRAAQPNALDPFFDLENWWLEPSD